MTYMILSFYNILKIVQVNNLTLVTVAGITCGKF